MDASASELDAARSVDAASRADAELGDAASAVPEPGRLVGITALHNAARARLAASPSLPPLSWSAEIAAVAQAYADTLAAACQPGLVHSTSEQRRGWGENLASFSASGRGVSRAPGTAAETVGTWESELACYTYSPFQLGVYAGCAAACGEYGGCGHYTQIIWRTTRRLGCGVADCMRDEVFRSYWVCHYDPPGNVLGVMPY